MMANTRDSSKDSPTPNADPARRAPQAGRQPAAGAPETRGESQDDGPIESLGKAVSAPLRGAAEAEEKKRLP